MGEVSFTAGITLHDDRVLTVDVTGIDGAGLAYHSAAGDGRITWEEVKAVMLATTDHMLESGGALFAMAETLERADGAGEAAEMRRLGAGVLRQAAPRICPLGASCGLRPDGGGQAGPLMA